MGKCIFCGKGRGSKTVKLELFGSKIEVKDAHSRCAHGRNKVNRKLLRTRGSEVYEPVVTRYQNSSIKYTEWKPLRNHH